MKFDCQSQIRYDHQPLSILSEYLTTNQTDNYLNCFEKSVISYSNNDKVIEKIDWNEMKFEDFCQFVSNNSEFVSSSTGKLQEPKCSLPKKYADHVKKVSVLEKLSQQFYCTMCNNFSTNSMVAFYKHINHAHPTKDVFYCIYCCQKVKHADYPNHIQCHFSDDMTNKDYCRLCRDWIDLTDDDHADVIKHIDTQHTDLKLEVACIFCKRKFVELEDLISHLNIARQKLYSCSDTRCMVMTHNEEDFKEHRHAFLDHGEERHQYFLNCPDNDRIGLPEFDLCCLMSKLKKMYNSELGVDLPSDLKLSILNDFRSLDCLRGIKIDFSKRVLKKLYRDEYDTIVAKLTPVWGKHIIMGYEILDSSILQKRIICSVCKHYSNFSLFDIKRHFLKIHGKLSNNDIKQCLFASLNNKLENSLATDKEMLAYINYERVGSYLSPLQDSEDEGTDDAIKPTKKGTHKRKIGVKNELPSEKVPNYSVKVIHELKNRQLITEQEFDILTHKLEDLSNYRAIFVRQKLEQEDKKNDVPTGKVKRFIECSACDKMKKYSHYSIFQRHVVNDHLMVPQKLRKYTTIAMKVDRNLELYNDFRLLTLI